MKDYDADEIIRNLEEKQRAGKSLEREELLKVLLTPLMDGKTGRAAVRRDGGSQETYDCGGVSEEA